MAHGLELRTKCWLILSDQLTTCNVCTAVVVVVVLWMQGCSDDVNAATNQRPEAG